MTFMTVKAQHPPGAGHWGKTARRAGIDQFVLEVTVRPLAGVCDGADPCPFSWRRRNQSHHALCTLKKVPSILGEGFWELGRR